MQFGEVERLERKCTCTLKTEERGFVSLEKSVRVALMAAHVNEKHMGVWDLDLQIGSMVALLCIINLTKIV